MTLESTATTTLGWREGVVIALAALVWFLPGLDWGLPLQTAEAVQGRWGVDELGPYGGLHVIAALRGGEVHLSPQYPLGQYLIQALFVWPWQLALRMADNLGLPAQTETLAGLVLVHRVPSVLMAAGTVALAAAFARQAGAGAMAARFAAAAVATIGPLGYYARTSNVDGPALFWVVLGLVLAAGALRHGLTTRRAVALGLVAAMGIATKDQQYAVFAGLALVVLTVHLRRPASVVEHRPWRAPVVGLLVAVAAYLPLSGALLLPRWFVSHVRFILQGSAPEIPEAIRHLVGFYFSNPATPAGYARVGAEVLAQVTAALGVAIVALAVVGAVHLIRRDRGLLALLLVPAAGLLLGVIAPVRFVLPRFLLPVELAASLLAAIGLGALALRPGQVRWAPIAALVAGGWGIIRGVDLTRQMTGDSREAAAEWLATHLAPGDTLAYYGSRFKLPRLRTDIVDVRGPHQYLPEEAYGPEGPATLTPPFIIVVPQQVSERDHEWTLPADWYRGLRNGTAGYQEVLAIQTPALRPRPLRVAPAVNPLVRVFARADILDRLGPAPTDRTVLTGATLIDGSGGAPLADARIIIQGGRIACVSGPDGCPGEAGDRQRDLTGKWIVPGLIDTHVHLPFAVAPESLLMRQQRLRFALGVTTVRDAGSGPPSDLLARQAAFEAPVAAVPRVVISARVGPDGDSAAVAALVRAGADAIKVKDDLPLDRWPAVLHAARTAGVPAYGHTWGGDSLPAAWTLAALAGGLRGVSHLMGLPLETQSGSGNLAPPDGQSDLFAWHKGLWTTAVAARLDTIARAMILTGAWLEPTLTLEYHWGRPLPLARELAFLGPAPSLRALLPGAAATSREGPTYPEPWSRQAAFVAAFAAAGGTVVAGSDGKAPGPDLLEEVRLIAEVTGSPMTGLLAATRNAAVALARRDRAHIEPGRLADLVVYARNPLADGAMLPLPVTIIKGGVEHDGAERLAEFRAEYDARVNEAWRQRARRFLPPVAGLVVLAVLGMAIRTRRRR